MAKINTILKPTRRSRILWILSILILKVMNLFPHQVLAQYAEGYIYGNVILKDDSEIEGLLRWGNEEVFWEDIFKAYKGNPPLKGLIDKEEASQLNMEDDLFAFDFMQLWENRSPELHFTFKCHFGDIDIITVTGKNRAAVQLKNKEWINVKHGPVSDLNQNINIYMKDNGHKRVSWDDIKRIHFRPTPKEAKPIGKPLYGEINTTKGSYSGYITWDMEECTGNDLLGGYMDNTKKEIKFKDIAMIKTHNDGSKVILKSGGELYLNNHDDTSNKNKGILVKTQTSGKVKIEWGEFISAEFFEACYPLKNKYAFEPPVPLQGTVVTTEDMTYTGNIVYDMDERVSVEMLDGENGGFYYIIPFNMVKSVTPQNFKYSLVTLENEDSIILGGHNDVNHGNNGLIISQSGQKHFVPWKEVKKVVFE